MQTDAFNRQLHAEEKLWIQKQAGGDPKKEARLTAAACALVRCHAEYATDSAAYRELKHLADIGASDAFAAERWQLRQSGLFTYTTTGLVHVNDKLKDSYRRFDNTYQITKRTLGAVEAVGGGVGLAASVAAAPAACSTGLGCLATTSVATLSADALYTGSTQLVSGQPQATIFNQALQELGLSPQAATYAELAFGLGSAATAGRTVGNTVLTKAQLSQTARLSYEDISKFNAKGFDVTQETLKTPQVQAILKEYLSAGLDAQKASIYTANLIKTGINLPAAVSIQQGEELIKLVPKNIIGGDRISAFSPYFMTRSEYESLSKLSSTQIAQKLALPAEQGIRGARFGFDVYAITPKPGTSPMAYTSTIAPIDQGAYKATGGAQQALVPNRSQWGSPVKIGSIKGDKP